MKHDVMYTKVFFPVYLFLCSVLYAHVGDAQPVIRYTPVITGLSLPMQLVNAGDGTNRIFIAEKGGTVRVYDQSYVFKGIFLTLTGLSTNGEQGLLSMVFHPDYAHNGFFFVYYTDLSGNLVLKRFKVSTDANSADPASGVTVLTIPHPGQSNHNGGEMHFGTDGYLYLSTGDGGGGNDPNNNAQNTTVLLGKMLRIAVNSSNTPPYYTNPATNPFPAGSGPKNEVYALGLRNPFRWSFDRQTQDMWIGDVGQSTQEEINHKTALTSLGANYGWRCYEGNMAHITGGCADSSQLHFPVYTYKTSLATGRSVIGGVVYRGSVYPKMAGYYIGADHYTGDIQVIGPVDGVPVTTIQKSSVTNISDFGEAENGEIYAVGLSANTVYAISGEDPLPVRLIHFSGYATDESVNLLWETAMEKDFDQFDIEGSKDGKSFLSIGTVPAQSVASGAKYQFKYAERDKGILYYRLKMTDRDQSFSYSKIILIHRRDAKPDVSFVRPSLVDNGVMNIFIDEPFSSLELVAVNGTILLKEDLSNRNGSIDIPVGELASGMYIVRLSGENKVSYQKVLIEQ